MNILAYDAYVPADVMEAQGVQKVNKLEDGLRVADFVTLHLPLTDKTRGMMKAAQFRSMKKTAYICNLGRGPMLDEGDLYQALING